MTPPAQDLAAENPPTGQLRGGLRARLWRSHLLVAACGLATLLIALAVFLWQRRTAVEIADIRGPAARASALALGGIQESRASLRSWVLLEKRQFVAARKEAWDAEIDPAM
nr:hypothetical protein [Planctomycetales bacterium]